MRIVLDPNACVGHGRCYALSPQVFMPDEIGHCEVVATEVDDYQLESARVAVASCPEDALQLLE